MLENQPSWEKYEDYTRHVLNDDMVQNYLEDYFNLVNLKIQPKKELPGIKTGTMWEVDGYGYDIDNQLVLIECKHYGDATVKQSELAAFAYIIQDIGASRGIFITTNGFQSGAIKIAEAESIGLLQLDYNSTNKNFVIRFKANETKPNKMVTAFTGQFNGIGFTTISSKITNYPIPTREEVEKARARLQQQTSRTHFSNDEIIEEVAKMRNEI
jgi:hypothetical protein